jgi:hypothetical protein
MANFKERLLGLIDNGASAAFDLIDKMNETFNSIDWDSQFENLSDMKDSLVKKGNDLLGEFNELMKQVKNGISDFEVTVPFDESLGEKLETKIEDGKLTVEVSFKDETSERSNKTTVLIPQNCDIEKMETKFNTLAKTATVVIPKVIKEHVSDKDEEKGYKLKKSATPKKKVSDSDSHEAASKLLKKFRENSGSTSGIKRGANGRFVKRTATTD